MNDLQPPEVPDQPVISAELIRFLDRAFPAAPPNLKDTEREVWFKAGQRDLVVRLIAIHNSQQEAL